MVHHFHLFMYRDTVEDETVNKFRQLISVWVPVHKNLSSLLSIVLLSFEDNKVK